MAYFRIDLYMKALRREASFEMFIPNDEREDEPDKERVTKTLFLLHGYTGKAGNWISEEIARKYHFAIVMPSCENGFYLDGLSTGHQYQSMMKELVDYVRSTFGLAQTADETYICGMSMGGFGALHTAFAWPQIFGKVGAMSSAMIIHRIAHMKDGDEDKDDVANYAYYHECFGDLEKVEESMNNPETQILFLKQHHEKIPEIYMCCGTEDGLLETNREFHIFLMEHGIDHIYQESPGMHDMTFWNEYTPKIVEWMFT